MFKILYVYILKCSDGNYYTGVTNNLERRLKEHEIGTDREAYTFSRRPLELVYYEMFTDYFSAIDWETRIKKWSRKKKEALINSRWDDLKKYSECLNQTRAISSLSIKYKKQSSESS